MLRICPVDTNTSSWLSLDSRRKQVTVYDPSQYSGFTAPSRRTGNAPPKMFAFDAIFPHDDTLVGINLTLVGCRFGFIGCLTITFLHTHSWLN